MNHVTGDAIKCWTCSSQTDPGCDVPFIESLTMELVDCDFEDMQIKTCMAMRYSCKWNQLVYIIYIITILFSGQIVKTECFYNQLNGSPCSGSGSNLKVYELLDLVFVVSVCCLSRCMI